MRLEYILLADKAEALNGKLYMLGGGWDTLTLMGVPAIAAYDLAAALVFDSTDAGLHQLEFALTDESNSVVLGPLGAPIEVPLPNDGAPSRLILVLGGPFPMPSFGDFQWRVLIDGSPVGQVSLRVRPAANAPQSENASEAPTTIQSA